MESKLVTLEVSHAPMSSLKDDFPSNKDFMSVTPPVAHVEMWPYVASADVASESHAATAILIFPLAMTLPSLGMSQPPQETPHNVDTHGVPLNAWVRSTSSATHQPRSWSKAELPGSPSNIISILVTLSTLHLPIGWLNDEAMTNIIYMLVTLEVSHALISSLKDNAAVLQLLHPGIAQNKYAMSVTPDVSQVEMWPYVASAADASANHASRAVYMLLSVMT